MRGASGATTRLPPEDLPSGRPTSAAREATGTALSPVAGVATLPSFVAANVSEAALPRPLTEVAEGVPASLPAPRPQGASRATPIPAVVEASGLATEGAARAAETRSPASAAQEERRRAARGVRAVRLAVAQKGAELAARVRTTVGAPSGRTASTTARRALATGAVVVALGATGRAAGVRAKRVASPPTTGQLATCHAHPRAGAAASATAAPTERRTTPTVLVWAVGASAGVTALGAGTGAA